MTTEFEYLRHYESRSAELRAAAAQRHAARVAEREEGRSVRPGNRRRPFVPMQQRTA